MLLSWIFKILKIRMGSSEDDLINLPAKPNPLNTSVYRVAGE